MKLAKAIEILGLAQSHAFPPEHSDLHHAIVLGIEAQKAVIESRRIWGSQAVPLLPGETAPDDPDELSDLIRAQIIKKADKQ